MFQPEKDFEKYGMFVFKYLMSLCGNADLAEELTQETFIGQFVLRGNLMETARFPHGFAKLRSISGIKNWIGEGERKPNRCRKTERGMAWKMIIAGKNRRWK